MSIKLALISLPEIFSKKFSFRVSGSFKLNFTNPSSKTLPEKLTPLDKNFTDLPFEMLNFSAN